MPTKVRFHDPVPLLEFWASEAVRDNPLSKPHTFTTDHMNDESDYFSVSSNECFPKDIPEFISIDLNDLVNEKPVHYYVMPYYQSVLLKRAQAAKAAALMPPTETAPPTKKNRRWWFGKGTKPSGERLRFRKRRR